MLSFDEFSPDGLTTEQRWALWRKEEAEYEAKFSHRKAEEHHTRCRDCGVFVTKSRWIKKDAYNAVQHQRRPLCHNCWLEGDHDC
ncbi:hypothetical protein G7008_03595 [Pseudomonas psychrotolerans]|uniref:hypothetical protein n=1 Tax=Pseudomonas oryzihabitans TaxID=47885 RepID=UPI0015E2FE71|nr:hypothetical protein [Pseudomonas psychrotolerans]MBA1179579.1 hypothetical protein [Pseudomonas psychrotolerans]MBA1212182.1 hypothetical protein [Pseudomonas psychrotolerans]